MTTEEAYQEGYAQGFKDALLVRSEEEQRLRAKDASLAAFKEMTKDEETDE